MKLFIFKSQVHLEKEIHGFYMLLPIKLMQLMELTSMRNRINFLGTNIYPFGGAQKSQWF